MAKQYEQDDEWGGEEEGVVDGGRDRNVSFLYPIAYLLPSRFLLPNTLYILELIY